MRYTFDAYLPDGSPRRHVGTFRPPYEEARETLMPGALAISSARGPDTWTPYMAGLADRPLYELEEGAIERSALLGTAGWIPLEVGSLVAVTDSETGAVGRYEVARVSLEHMAVYLGTAPHKVRSDVRPHYRYIDLFGSKDEPYSDARVEAAVLVNALCHAILKESGGLPGEVLIDVVGDHQEFASDIAKTLIGREVEVGWASLQPGKVVAIHDARTGRTVTLRVKDVDVAEDGGSGTIHFEPLPVLSE